MKKFFIRKEGRQTSISIHRIIFDGWIDGKWRFVFIIGRTIAKRARLDKAQTNNDT